MEEEGEDPTTFKFEIAVETKTPSKKTRRSESTVEQETEDTPAMEDMIVQDDAGEDEDAEHEGAKAAPSEPPSQADDSMEVDEKASRKRDIKDDTEATEAKKLCLDKETKCEEDQKGENNTDAEDSINLDLGEDELLNEEVCFYFFKVTVTLPSTKSSITNGFMMEVD